MNNDKYSSAKCEVEKYTREVNSEQLEKRLEALEK